MIEPEVILEHVFFSSDYNKKLTVRTFLKLILKKFWIEGASFQSKKNSGWTHDLEVAFIQAGFINGTLDENKFVLSYDSQLFDKLMIKAIKAM